MAFTLVQLGVVDQGAQPPDVSSYFKRIHEGPMIANAGAKFRGEAKGAWVPFKSVPAKPVSALQTFLRDAGFAPFGKVDGICGYRTNSAIRLFQEYVRSVEKDRSIGVPDGVYGPKTAEHVERWKQAGKQADWVGTTSEQYDVWMDLLGRVKRHYQAHPTALHQRVAAYPHASDTRAVDDWLFDPGQIHLVGVRRNQSAPLTEGKRQTDDIFLLLINGAVFKFFGTTDPGTTTNRKGAPFLCHGQHRYRFGWHKMSDKQTVYRALKPLSSGVLVVRDGNRDFALSETEDLEGEVERNASINVHWGGRGGTAAWSAGCQVICGRSYINHLDETVDCSAFAAGGYSSLGQHVQGGRKTKGAYSVLVDLVTAFSGDVHAVDYMLLYERDLALSPRIGAEHASRLLERMA